MALRLLSFREEELLRNKLVLPKCAKSSFADELSKTIPNHITLVKDIS